MEEQQEKGILERAAEQAAGYEARIERQKESINKLLMNNRAAFARVEEVEFDLETTKAEAAELKAKLDFANAHLALTDHQMLRCPVCRERSDDAPIKLEDGIRQRTGGPIVAEGLQP